MEERFFDRELSWVEFNARVLGEALREDVPLFERLNFLGIVETNFDEFFQVRVASLKRSDDEKNAADILKKISTRVHQLTEIQYKTLYDKILPELAKEKIVYISPKDYSSAQATFARGIFKHEIFPLLTPLRTDGDSFPSTGSLHLNAAFILEPMEGVKTLKTSLVADGEKEILALVQIPSAISRIVWLPSENGEKYFTLVDDLILEFGKDLFAGFRIAESMIFKVARDADFSVDENSGTHFIEAMESVLEQRQSSFIVRMECTRGSSRILSALKEKLRVSEDDVYETGTLIDPSTITEISRISGQKNLFYKKWENYFPADLPEEGTYWNTLRQRDILLHVPYQSYDPVVRFIQNAAKDDDVLAIKMTLYRTGSKSPIVEALKEAAKKGKQVTAFVELKARFDEKRNIHWAAELEKAGAIVVYGIVNLKLHAKICLVVRKESDGIRRYAHISTGNYNPKTAKVYQDLSVFTSSNEIVNDATFFFNVISGYSRLQTMHHLYMAPVTLKSRLLELIDREIKKTTPEKPGHICAKMNNLCHPEIVEALYRASQAGVKIDLNVRGICTVIPGVKGMSENIKVVSIIDRYLEHSRIYYFENGDSPEIYLSSADWMERNLDKRIELMFPITDKEISSRVKEILWLYFRDNTRSYTLESSGTWKQNAPKEGEEPVRAQEILHREYKMIHKAKKENDGEPQFVVRRK